MKLKLVGRCDEGWDRMEPRPDGRFCHRCDRTVVDLTRLTGAQAESRVRRARGRLCGHALVHTGSGDVVFRPPAPSVAPRWAGGLVLAASLASGCASASPDRSREAPTASIEPEPVPVGPPLEPIDPAAVAAPRPQTRAVPAAELACADAPVEPSAMQRHLTARKHAPPTPAVVTSPHYAIYDGMMEPVF